MYQQSVREPQMSWPDNSQWQSRNITENKSLKQTSSIRDLTANDCSDDGARLENMIANAPLDLTVFADGKQSRNAESPLDLSCKTRKRCADSTEERQFNLNRLVEHSAEKKLCTGLKASHIRYEPSSVRNSNEGTYIDKHYKQNQQCGYSYSNGNVVQLNRQNCIKGTQQTQQSVKQYQSTQNISGGGVPNVHQTLHSKYLPASCSSNGSKVTPNIERNVVHHRQGNVGTIHSDKMTVKQDGGLSGYQGQQQHARPHVVSQTNIIAQQQQQQSLLRTQQLYQQQQQQQRIAMQQRQSKMHQQSALMSQQRNEVKQNDLIQNNRRMATHHFYQQQRQQQLSKESSLASRTPANQCNNFIQKRQQENEEKQFQKHSVLTAQYTRRIDHSPSVAYQQTNQEQRSSAVSNMEDRKTCIQQPSQYHHHNMAYMKQRMTPDVPQNGVNSKTQQPSMPQRQESIKQMNNAQYPMSQQSATSGSYYSHPHQLYQNRYPTIQRCSPDSTNVPSHSSDVRCEKLDVSSDKHRQYSPSIRKNLSNAYPPTIEYDNRNSISTKYSVASKPLSGSEIFAQAQETSTKSSFAGSNISTNRSSSSSSTPSSSPYSPAHNKQTIFGVEKKEDVMSHLFSTVENELNAAHEKEVLIKPVTGNITDAYKNRKDAFKIVNEKDIEVKNSGIIINPSSGQENVSLDEKSKDEKTSKESENFSSPLSISIPTNGSGTSDPSAQNSSTVKTEPETKQVKCLSKKQLILNAVNKDEGLKKIVASVGQKPKQQNLPPSENVSKFGPHNNHTQSPTFPESPKMPTLSPQQKLPTPVVSPLINEPPTLDPAATPGYRQRLESKMSLLRKPQFGNNEVKSIKTPTPTQSTFTNNADVSGNKQEYAIQGLNTSAFTKRPSMLQKRIPIANVAPMVHRSISDSGQQEINDLEKEDESNLKSGQILPFTTDIQTYNVSRSPKSKFSPQSKKRNSIQVEETGDITETSLKRGESLRARKRRTRLRRNALKLCKPVNAKRAKALENTQLDTLQSENQNDDNADKNRDGMWEVTGSGSTLRNGKPKGGLMLKLFFRPKKKRRFTRKQRRRPRGRINIKSTESEINISTDKLIPDRRRKGGLKSRSTKATGYVDEYALQKEDVAVFCLKSGRVEVNAKDNAGYTPLHECSVSGHMGIARLLLSYGANVNCSSQDGIRPVHDAVENDHIEIVRLLMTFGADPTISTYTGRTPLKIARSRKMQLLIKGHLGDLNGFELEHEEFVWDIPSQYLAHDDKLVPETNIFSDIPPDPELEGDDDIFTESSEPMFSMLEVACSSHREKFEKCALLRDVTDYYKVNSVAIEKTSGVKSSLNISKDQLLNKSLDFMLCDRILSIPGSSCRLLKSQELMQIIQKCERRNVRKYVRKSKPFENGQNSNCSESSPVKKRKYCKKSSLDSLHVNDSRQTIEPEVITDGAHGLNSLHERETTHKTQELLSNDTFTACKKMADNNNTSDIDFMSVEEGIHLGASPTPDSDPEDEFDFSSFLNF
ncbi:hypothetical protein KUTeg_012445 [Tegillarca granosa]|uniref:BCL-6 corepressor n=1 Tax=Tegillarca granosa TaxID=220873 RepID=A0ABQ9EZJ2_TEGGR|nr:hypothetical protein KUTeg_012445 [Tegillarca granosa]